MTDTTPLGTFETDTPERKITLLGAGLETGMTPAMRRMVTGYIDNFRMSAVGLLGSSFHIAAALDPRVAKILEQITDQLATAEGDQIMAELLKHLDDPDRDTGPEHRKITINGRIFGELENAQIRALYAMYFTLKKVGIDFAVADQALDNMLEEHRASTSSVSTKPLGD
jgi:hypothetical protein